jgi:hypothetical protein
MIRQIAFGLLLGTLIVAACGGNPDSPSSVSPPQTATPPPSSPPSPGPAPTPLPSPAGSTIPGVYSLTLDIGSGCAVVPEADRVRSYTATIAYAADGRYVVTLSGAKFLTGLICTGGSRHFAGIGCDQFFASEDIDIANFFLENNNDEAHGGHIVEQVSSGGWMEVIAGASGALNRTPIVATGMGSVWYCRTSMSYPFPCTNFVSCRSSDMRLTFARK